MDVQSCAQDSNGMSIEAPSGVRGRRDARGHARSAQAAPEAITGEPRPRCRVVSRSSGRADILRNAADLAAFQVTPHEPERVIDNPEQRWTGGTMMKPTNVMQKRNVT